MCVENNNVDLRRSVGTLCLKNIYWRKVENKTETISSPDCSGNPFLVTELAEVTKKGLQRKAGLKVKNS